MITLLPDDYDNHELRSLIGSCINLLSKININKILMLPSHYLYGYNIEYGEPKVTYRFVFKNYHPKILVDITDIEIKRYILVAFDANETFDSMGSPFPIDYYLVKRSM
jgi:hypothetical protein